MEKFTFNRRIESSPEWTPGVIDEKHVPVTFTFPLVFKLMPR
jgi:hypothetical protein